MRIIVAGVLVLASCVGLSACKHKPEAGIFASAGCLGITACGGDPGDPATVTLPTITTQPSSLAVAVGSAAEFSVVATGGGLSYQWSKDGTSIPDAVSATYTIPATTAGSAGSYQVVVSNTQGSITSSVAVLTLDGAALAPIITTHPVSLTVAAGGTATFTVVASGTPPLLYQWFRNDVLITAATTATYSVPDVTALDAGSYTVSVSNGQGNLISNAAVLMVTGTTPTSGGMSFDDGVLATAFIGAMSAAKLANARAAVGLVAGAVLSTAGFAHFDASSARNDYPDEALDRMHAERANAILAIFQGQATSLAPTSTGSQALTAAYLRGQAFADVVITPTTPLARFPVFDRGVQVSSLGAPQQALVTTAISEFVSDYDSATRARLLADYTSGNAYAGTYVAWGGSVGSTDPDADADMKYLRIDGPRVWIEIFSRSGVGRQGAEHHMIFRDKSLNYQYELVSRVPPI